MMSTRSRILLGIASLSLALAFVLPLWAVYLNAPQYPEGLGMLIRVNDIIGLNGACRMRSSELRAQSSQVGPISFQPTI